MRDRQTGRFPEIGGGSARQNGLDAHVLSGKLLMKRKGQSQNERLRSAEHTVENFRSDPHGRSYVDDGAAPRGEARRRGIDKPGKRGHVECNHLAHLANVGRQ